MIITIKSSSRKPLYIQVSDGICDAIANGQIKPGDRLPPGRHLASVLGVNLETIQKAYRLLVSEGLASSKVGRGTQILKHIEPSTLGVDAQIRQIVKRARQSGTSLKSLQERMRKHWMDTIDEETESLS